MPQITKGHNSRSIFQKFLQNQVVYSSLPVYSSSFKALTPTVFEIFCWQDCIHFFSKDHNSEKGHNPAKKKIRVSYFFMRNPYKKFQNSSMHGSKIMLCIKKRDERTDGKTDGWTNNSEAICWGHSYAIFSDQSFNDALTYDIVSFEQLGSDHYKAAYLNLSAQSAVFRLTVPRRFLCCSCFFLCANGFITRVCFVVICHLSILLCVRKLCFVILIFPGYLDSYFHKEKRGYRDITLNWI